MNLLRPTVVNSKKRNNHARRLSVEPLERRDLLAGFNYVDFSSAASLNLIGDAAVTSDNRLRLTPAVGGTLGAAWYSAEKQFVASQFSTTFQFQLTENADPPGGSDGLVFVIQNTDPTFLGGGGGPLGYNQLANSLAIEFDTFQNSEANDPSHSHISIHTNGSGLNSWLESFSIGSYDTSPALLDDTAVHTVRISYHAETLSVYLDDLQTPKISVAVDLPNLLALDAGRAWVGFTAATTPPCRPRS